LALSGCVKVQHKQLNRQFSRGGMVASCHHESYGACDVEEG
jgi:hypothetical protein